MTDMSDSFHQPEQPAGAQAPSVRVRHARWRFPLVWVVPALAALVAGYLVYERVPRYGPEISIRFKDVSGLKTGQTPIRYRGVAIGTVTALELAPQHQYALARARLQRSAAGIARSGTVFWIVRPEVGIGNITGLGTVITGPEIGVMPGTGAVQQAFVGLERAPVAKEREGLNIVLRARRLGALQPHSPVYFRGIAVGAVQDSQLSRNADAVDIHVFIQPRYASLVRGGSRFWDVSGVKLHAGLWRGIDLKVESLRSLVAGGIAFATPGGGKSPAVRSGTVFPLHDDPHPAWLAWRPPLPLPPEEGPAAR